MPNFFFSNIKPTFVQEKTINEGFVLITKAFVFINASFICKNESFVYSLYLIQSTYLLEKKKFCPSIQELIY
ncbi:hypothetical protein QR305_01622 [Bacteroides finegoldii]|uniref:Uncharacterized protein n=1 Tax=Bacteroides finegoldii CL09T03C10 TaxID=997888 RepID=K5BVT0_9BACE|nr:hypothetical protein HMPREF1057_00195 [Bacteroides finegoldii CL09T03C10]